MKALLFHDLRVKEIYNIVCDLDSSTLVRQSVVYFSIHFIITAGTAHSAYLARLTTYPICFFFSLCMYVSVFICVLSCSFRPVCLFVNSSVADQAIFISSATLSVGICMCVCVHGWNDHWVSCCGDQMLDSILFIQHPPLFYPWLLYLDKPCCSVWTVFSFCGERSRYLLPFHPWHLRFFMRGPHKWVWESIKKKNTT